MNEWEVRKGWSVSASMMGKHEGCLNVNKKVLVCM